MQQVLAWIRRRSKRDLPKAGGTTETWRQRGNLFHHILVCASPKDLSYCEDRSNVAWRKCGTDQRRSTWYNARVHRNNILNTFFDYPSPWCLKATSWASLKYHTSLADDNAHSFPNQPDMRLLLWNADQPVGARSAARKKTNEHKVSSTYVTSTTTNHSANIYVHVSLHLFSWLCRVCPGGKTLFPALVYSVH